MNMLLSGALGHMGREVARLAQEAGDRIALGVDAQSGAADFPLYRSFDEVQSAAGDVIIDFSRPEGLEPLLRYALREKIPAVLCTTGYTQEQLDEIDRASREIAVFRSANMSVGVALLTALSRRAAEILGDEFDVEIVEAHHNRKADAPSGTALMLLDAVKAGYDTPHEAVFGRHGRDCRRKQGEIGVHALRGGTVTGEHEVCFFGPSERIKLCHSAENRSVFASGALKAAAFLLGKAPGLYDMSDLVGKI